MSRAQYADRPKFLAWFDELQAKCNEEVDIDDAFELYDDGHDVDYAVDYFNCDQ